MISGGASAEAVAFASLSRWGKVASVIQKLDAAGDIAAWAQMAGRGIKLPRKLMDKLGDARKRVEAEAGQGRGPDGLDAGGPGNDVAAPRSPDLDGPSRAPQEYGAWETGTRPGLPATPETIAHGTCAMEAHPDFSKLVDEAKSKGFELIYDHKAHVANIRVVDEAGELIEMRRELHVIADMRFLDLEHELGHIRQLERFGPNPPPTETKVRLANGTEDFAENELRQGTLNSGQNAVVEYHNRLDEYVRLAERGLPAPVMKEHAQDLIDWRMAAETAGLGQGGGRGSFHRWAKELFPEIPRLERRARELGGEFGPSKVRWEEVP